MTAWLSGGLLFVCALVTLASWAIVSPPSSSPDDDYHIPSIYCAQGISDLCQTSDRGETVRVLPSQLVYGRCFGLDYSASGGCSDDLPTTLVPNTHTDRGNWNKGYPPVFYGVASLFAGDNLARSVVLIRLFNGLLAVGLLAAVAVLVPRQTRPLVLAPLTLTAVPIGLYFLASTNPSSWAILAMAALWPALYASFDATGVRRYLLLAAAVAATVVGAGARTDAALFDVFVIVLVCLLRARELRANLPILGAAALCVAIAGFLFLNAGQSDLGGFGPTEGVDTTWHLRLFMNLKELPILVLGSFSYGYMGTTGWLDTPFPAAVGALGIMTWFGMIFHWSRHLSRGKALAMGVTGLALLAYPLVLLTRSSLVVGAGFQPRYALPLLIVFTGMALLRGRDGLPSLGRAQFWFAVVALSIAHLLALHTQLRRYLTGLDVTDLSLNGNIEWWWDVPFSPNTAWLVASAAFTIVVYLVLRDLRDPREPATDEVEEAEEPEAARA